MGNHVYGWRCQAGDYIVFRLQLRQVRIGFSLAVNPLNGRCSGLATVQTTTVIILFHIQTAG